MGYHRHQSSANSMTCVRKNYLRMFSQDSVARIKTMDTKSPRCSVPNPLDTKSPYCSVPKPLDTKSSGCLAPIHGHQDSANFIVQHHSSGTKFPPFILLSTIAVGAKSPFLLGNRCQVFIYYARLQNSGNQDSLLLLGSKSVDTKTPHIVLSTFSRYQVSDHLALGW